MKKKNKKIQKIKILNIPKVFWHLNLYSCKNTYSKKKCEEHI